jgi:hypothetical protein
MISEERIKEINEQQDALRKERNDYCSKMNACQNQIDDLEKEKYDVNSYLDKIIYIGLTSLKHSTHIYMQVKKIERLIQGPRFSGPCIEIHREGNTTCYIETASNRETTQYSWKDIQNGTVQIVSDFQEIKDDLIVAGSFLNMGDLPIPKLDGDVINTKKYRYYVETPHE